MKLIKLNGSSFLDKEVRISNTNESHKPSLSKLLIQLGVIAQENGAKSLQVEHKEFNPYNDELFD